MTYRSPVPPALLTAAVPVLLAGTALLGLTELRLPLLPTELDLAEAVRAGAPSGLPSPFPEGRALQVELGRAAFALFSVSALALRVPSWALSMLGLASAAAFAKREASPGTAFGTVIVLATTPLYFLNARTATGHMLSLSMALLTFTALFRAVSEAQGTSATKRVLFAAVALFAGILGASAQGLLLAVGVPALAVGAPGLCATTKGSARLRAMAAAGLAALVIVAALVAAATGREALSTWVLGPVSRGPIADAVSAPWVAMLYALFPWCGLVPVACVSLLRRKPDAGTKARLAVVLAVLLSCIAHACLATRNPVAPFSFVGCMALTIAMWLQGSFRLVASWASRCLVCVTGAAISYLVCSDMGRVPRKSLHALALVVYPTLTEAQGQGIGRSFRIAALVFVALLALSLVPLRARGGPVGVLSGLLGSTAVTALGAIIAGALLRGQSYPRLLRELAPGSGLAALSQIASAQDRVALWGMSEKAFAYLPGAPKAVLACQTAEEAVSLLASEGGPTSGRTPSGQTPSGRTLVAFERQRLPELNALCRSRFGHNVWVLGAQDNAVLLGASHLQPHETNANPISRLLPDQSQSPSHALRADLDHKIEVLGWDLSEGDGPPAASVGPRKNVHVRFKLRVTADLSGGYCTFLHLDHAPTRLSAEHKDFAEYPMRLWRAGDVVVDDFALTLPPHFTQGSYTLWFGVGLLPCQDDRRLPVVSGDGDGNGRVRAGQLVVR